MMKRNTNLPPSKLRKTRWRPQAPLTTTTSHTQWLKTFGR